MDRAMISVDFSHTFASESDYFVFFFDFIHFSYISCRYSAVLTPLSQLWQHGRFSYGQGEFSTCKSRMTDAQEKLCRISGCGYKECNYKLINKAAQHKTQGLHEQPRHRLPPLIVSLLSETGLIDTFIDLKRKRGILDLFCFYHNGCIQLSFIRKRGNTLNGLFPFLLVQKTYRKT